MPFSYVLDKIRSATIVNEPFRHIQINNFFTERDFSAIVSAPEIAFPPQSSDDQLFQTLFGEGFKIIDFPGCITNKDIYLDWHKDKRLNHKHNNTACEGFGITLRLMQSKSSVIAGLMNFLNGQDFQTVLLEKFGIDSKDVFYDAGIQKYLDGYEISPHPDIRKKALTFMVNINSNPKSEDEDHHTHYLKFRDPYKYIQTYWEGNPDMDRCWVPWEWCDTKKIQKENNSIVIFSPANNTIHGVKARYDHLSHQRTQLYGNLWYHEELAVGTPAWENFVIKPEDTKQKTLKGRVASVLPDDVKTFLKSKFAKDDLPNVINDRLKRN